MVLTGPAYDAAVLGPVSSALFVLTCSECLDSIRPRFCLGFDVRGRSSARGLPRPFR